VRRAVAHRAPQLLVNVQLHKGCSRLFFRSEGIRSGERRLAR
jgi:hypothetical protein